MWTIPLCDIAFDETELKAVEGILRSGWLTMGEVSEHFENAFAREVGAKHAIAVSSGTAALHLAHLALGVCGKNEVICPSLTFVAGANTILYAGGKPVFADITGYDDFSISPEAIEANITSRTRAVQVMHYGGYPCDMGRIQDIVKQYGLGLIEDCSHAPGAEYNGQRCGTLGHVGCFSFFSNKNMTTAEGGMITTNEDALAIQIRSMRSHGMSTVTLERHQGRAFTYDVNALGFNYRLDEIRSSLGIVQLKKLETFNRRRQELTRLYRERLAGLEGLHLPFGTSHGSPSHHIYPVLLDRSISRRDFMAHLKNRGIQTSIHYPPIHLFQFYRLTFGYERGHLPLTEDVADREVTLPLYPTMGEDAVHYVSDAVVDYFTQ